MGAKGINLLMSTLQNRLVDHGYVTTRVLAPSQDLKSGILRLVIIPGVVRHVRLTPDSDDYIQLYSSFPAHEGSLLDLRDIEQGLENMQRLPGVQADMEIVPGEQPGESDILITRKQDKYWRLGFSLDDSGTRSTGRYLGGITFSLDNPFSLSDLLYVSATHNFPHYGGKGSKNYTAHYSVPFGYWQFSVTASDYDYHQTVAGAVEDYQYSGESQNLGMQLSRVTLSGQQITRLTELPLAYNLQCSAQLLQQLMVLFPDNPRVQEMVDNWQKSVRSRALPEEAMTGWNEGMTRLQQLAERLNRLDEQRGKYMTVSELKTEVFGIMQAFNRHIPAEERLRRYDEARNQNGSEQQQKQMENALMELLNRYYFLTRNSCVDI